MRQRIDQRSGSCSASEMVPGQGDASARRRSCGKATWISGDMIRVLADLQDSGMIYFQGSLARSEGHNDHKFGTDVELALPPAFLREHGDKFEDYVVFWTRSSTKPWVVQVSIFEEPDGAVDVKFADGWDEFAADNRLKPGDSLIFVLNVPQPEFMVYIFQGTGMSSRASARNTDNRTRLSKQTWRSLSDGHRKDRQKNGRKTGGLLIGKKAVQECLQSADSAAKPWS
ncbi:hypothetical protein KC19_4G043900 [Ceratodon purpureus]|uniref:TF-B3 domain-containing protein n=1 Tax=Ceratodon purpureus TaxID=3225 RepID=A0A8T0I5H4_CERPU|nr:hypothetical protein KC19_4G043900 [Ceratodon purpureus]